MNYYVHTGRLIVGDRVIEAGTAAPVEGTKYRFEHTGLVIERQAMVLHDGTTGVLLPPSAQLYEYSARYTVHGPAWAPGVPAQFQTYKVGLTFGEGAALARQEYVNAPPVMPVWLTTSVEGEGTQYATPDGGSVWLTELQWMPWSLLPVEDLLSAVDVGEATRLVSGVVNAKLGSRPLWIGMRHSTPTGVLCSAWTKTSLQDYLAPWFLQKVSALLCGSEYVPPIPSAGIPVFGVPVDFSSQVGVDAAVVPSASKPQVLDICGDGHRLTMAEVIAVGTAPATPLTALAEADPGLAGLDLP